MDTKNQTWLCYAKTGIYEAPKNDKLQTSDIRFLFFLFPEVVRRITEVERQLRNQLKSDGSRLILSTKGVFQPSVCHRPKASNLSLPYFQTHGFSCQVSLIENSYKGVGTCTSQIRKACHTTLPAIPEEGRVTKQHERQQPAICCCLGKASHAAMTTYPWKKNK